MQFEHPPARLLAGPLVGLGSLIATLALAPPALAQSGASGSADFRSPARALAPAGGQAASESVTSEVQLALVGGGEVSVSNNYRFRGGAVWTGNAYTPPGPTVFGVASGSGSKDGGESVTVFGAGFLSGAPVVTAIGGQPVSAQTVVSDGELLVQTPAGVDLLGNPLGPTSVTVDDGTTSSTAPDAYVYTPALLSASDLRIGQPAEIALAAPPGSLIQVLFGVPLPGLALPVAGLDGAFDLVALSVSPFPTAFAGADPFLWSFDLPNEPNLVGKTLDWQGLAITEFAPIAGSFTNRISTPIGG